MNSVLKIMQFLLGAFPQIMLLETHFPHEDGFLGFSAMQGVLGVSVSFVCSRCVIVDVTCTVTDKLLSCCCTNSFKSVHT